jgi:enoyl-CoA hydratase
LLSVEGAIATITLNRPESLNAFNSQVWLDLERIAQEVATREDVRVAIVTGAGERAFSAGLDVKAAATGDLDKVGSDGRGWIGHMTRMKGIFTKYEELPIPVIAAINGYCLGAGLEFVLTCDIRLAAEHARFGLPEVKLGIVPDMGSTQRLPRVVGLGKARELIYTSRTIDAVEALRIGLVEHVYPRERLWEEVLTLAREIAAHAPSAVQGAKRAIKATMSLSLDAGLRLETEIAAATVRMEGLAEQGAQLQRKKE